MADKKLVIALEGKVSPSIQQMVRTLEGVQANINKATKAMQGLAGGGAGAESLKVGNLAKSLLGEKKLFEDLGKSGEKLAKVLNEQVTKSQASLAKQLESSTKSLEQLVKKHESAQARVQRMRGRGDYWGASQVQTYADQIGQDIVGAADEQRQAQAALDALKSPKGVGAIRSIMNSIPGLAGLTAMGGAVMGLNMLSQVPGQMVGYYQAPHLAAANLGGTAASAYFGAARGSVSETYALGMTLHDKDRAAMRDMARENAMMGQVRSLIFGGGGISGFFDPFSRINTIRTWDDVQAQAVLGVDATMLQAMKSKPGMQMTMAQIEAMQARAGRDVRAMRTLGGFNTLSNLHVMGQGAQMMPAETQALAAQLASMGGVGDLYSTFPLAANAMKGGLGAPAATAMAVARLLGGGNLLDRNTGLDLTIQNMLGQHVAAAVMNPASLLTSGEGYMGMLASGINSSQTGVMQQRILQQNIAGAGSMASLFGGADPYQKSLNLVNAIDVLGPGASLYAQSKLSKFGRDPKALADILYNGVVPDALKGVGITGGQVREYADLTLGSILNRYREAGGGGPGGEMLERLMGLNPAAQRSMLAGMGQAGIDQMAGVLSEVAPDMFADEGAAAGFLRGWGGIRGGPGKLGKREDGAMAGGGPTPELNALNASINQAVTNFEKLGGKTAEVGAAFTNATYEIEQATIRLQKAADMARGMARGLFGATPIDEDTPGVTTTR